MAHASTKVIFGAVFANLGIAIAKFVAAGLGGSPAMISEGIHSVVDSGNGLLLFLGVRLSMKPADDLHPFGHGKDLYFWALVVAMVIFAIGGGMSVYEGLIHLNAPHATASRLVSYVVLAVAFGLECISMGIAAHEFRKSQGKRSVYEAVRGSKDPAVFAVLYEDAAALLGLVIAFFGIALGQWLDLPWIEGAASIVIGGMLAAVAVLLAYESRGLLLGERASPGVVTSIRSIAEQDPAVERVDDVLTMHLGPREVLCNLGVRFRPALGEGEAVATLARLEKGIREAHPEVKRIFVRPSDGPSSSG